MSYTLKSVTIRTDNSKEGIMKIGQLWNDIASGKLPILFDSEHKFQQGVSPISVYSNYENGAEGEYDLTIEGVTSEFFKDIEDEVQKRNYVKYETTGDNVDSCTVEAWQKVWNDSRDRNINRLFTEDYESSVPKEFTKDGKAHCYLYIAVDKKA